MPLATRPTRLALTGALLLACTLPCASVAHADAALAVGRPADVARQGIAVGWAVDHPNREAAEKEALARCRAFADAPQAAREACRIVAAFSDRCFAVALEPEPGTSGIGWDVHRNRDRAEEAAMERCAETSAPKRRPSCRVALARCDGR